MKIGGNSTGETGTPKRATPVILTDREQEALVQGIKSHRSEQQQMLRARTVLAAAEGRSNAQIARELAITVDMVACGGIAGWDCKGSTGIVSLCLPSPFRMRRSQEPL